MPARPAARTRRGSDEVRLLVLDAARDLFVTHGYSNTRTKQIAEHAGVVEPVLFRHFGSKAALFEAAVVNPFADFVDSYAASWEVHEPDATAEDLVRDFVRGLYALVGRHRDLLLTLMGARVDDTDEVLAALSRRVAERFSVALRAIQRVLLEEGGARRYQEMDPPATIAATAGMVFSMVLMDDWLFPAGQRRPGQARQVEEITTIILHGIAHRGSPARGGSGTE